MGRWQATGFGCDLEYADVPDEPLPTRGVRVQVEACGVCHTDVHTWKGWYDLGDGERLSMAGRVKPPIVPGHEIAGVVSEVGPQVRDLAVGDRCVVYPWIGCGQCLQCAAGRDPYCRSPRYLGVDVPGGFADRVTVPDARYLVPTGGLDLQQAALLACSGLTAYSALRKFAATLGPADPLLIVGAGGLGLTALSLARFLTPAPVSVVDIDESRLAAARALGAAHTVLSRGPAPAKEALVRLAPDGFAAALDFVGSTASFETALPVLRKGATLSIAGLFGGRVTLPLPLLPARALTICGAYVGTLQELRELVDHARGGRFEPIPISPRPMRDAQQCLCALRDGRGVGRYVLRP